MSKFDDRFTTWYVCEPCGTRHADEYDAEKCCPPEIDELYICNVCEKECFDFKDAKEHLAESCKGSGGMSLHERYIEEVVMEGKPCLAEWAFTFAVENELPVKEYV